MTITTGIVFLLSFMAALGQFFMKRTVDKISWPQETKMDALAAVISAVLQKDGLLAVFLIGSSSLMYLIALRLGQMSIVTPLTAGLIIVFTALIGWFVLKEPMPALKLTGLAMMVFGIALVFRSA